MWRSGAGRGAVAAAVVVVLGLACANASAAGRACTRGKVAEPFTLPDGSFHPAGEVTFCLSDFRSPVRFLQTLYVDSSPIGMFGSRRDIVDVGNDAEQRYLIFERVTDERLRLSGYAVPGREGLSVYRLEQPARVKVQDSLRSSTERPAGELVALRLDRP